MGCPMCNWKTAILMVAGLAIIILPLGIYSFLGIGLVIAAWVWAMWPKKTCRIETGKAAGASSCKGDPATNE